MMGMIVIGGFIPSIMAAVQTPLTYVQKVVVQGKVVTESIAVQSTLDKIVPYLLPVVFVAFAYWLLRGLKLSAVWALIILAVGVGIGVGARVDVGVGEDMGVGETETTGVGVERCPFGA